MSTSTSKPSGVFSKAKSIFKKSKDGLSSLPEKVHMPRRSSVGAENSGDAVDVLDRLERVELSGREADEDSDEPGFGIRLKRSAGLVLPILKSDSRLNDLGMQLRELQLSMDKREHELRQKIQPSDAQGEKDRVRDLSAELRALQRSNAEAAEGPAHVALQIEELEDRIDAIKRHIYFPNTKYVFGCDGKYYAWDDMWVEHASGSIAVDMGSVAPAFKLGDRLSAGLQSRASIQLMGRPGGAGGGAETARNGVKLTVRLLHFGFKSENASLPTVFLEEVDLVLIVRIDCELLFTCGRGAVASKDGSAAAGIPSAGPAAASSRRGSTAPDGRRRDQPFDKIGPEPDSAIKTGDWTCESFTIDVVDFKGPFALGRSVMTTIAALITPKLKAWVLKKLPVELGSILLQTSSSASGAPCTASAAGDFSLTGTRLSLLSQRVHKPGELAQHLGCASEMLSVFRFVQKSMDTPTRIKSLSDMIRYVKLYSVNEASWLQLIAIWSSAIKRYYNLVMRHDATLLQGVEISPVFEQLSRLAQTVLRKPLSAELNLSRVDGQLSFTKALDVACSWLLRNIDKEAVEAILNKQISKNKEDVEAFKANRRTVLLKESVERRSVLELLKVYLTSAGMEASFRLHSGDDVAVTIKRAELTLPVTYLASSPINPFSTGLSIVSSKLLGEFSATESIQICIASPADNIADIKIKSSAIGETSGVISDSEIVATTVPNSENSVIFHGVLSDGSLGMVIDPVGAGSGGSSFGPGSSLFSVVLDSTNVVKEAVSSSEKRSVRDDYKLICECESRPILSMLTRALPELGVTMTEADGSLRVSTMIGGWPVVVHTNNCMRIGAHLGLANIALNINPFLQFLNALLTPCGVEKVDVPLRKYVSLSDEALQGLRKGVMTIAKYLSMEGVRADVSVKYKLDVLHYFTKSGIANTNGASESESIHSTDMVLMVSTPVMSAIPLKRSSFVTDVPVDKEVKYVVSARVTVYLVDLFDDIFSLKSLLIEDK